MTTATHHAGPHTGVSVTSSSTHQCGHAYLLWLDGTRVEIPGNRGYVFKLYRATPEGRTGWLCLECFTVPNIRDHVDSAEREAAESTDYTGYSRPVSQTPVIRGAGGFRASAASAERRVN